MTLLRAFDVSLSFGSRILFHQLELVIEAEERVGLVGANGTGKSTLMQILAGVKVPDSGTLQLRRGGLVTYLPQEPGFPEGATLASELSVPQGHLKDALAEYHSLSASLEHAPQHKAEDLERLSTLSEQIDRLGGWDTAHQAKTLLDRLGVAGDLWDRPVSTFSGGMKKRAAIARALLSTSDLLLLDEPTNHLDAETVEWLEEALDRFTGSILLVTHDRYFLDGLVDRIVELEPYVSPQQPGGLTSYPGNYEAFLEQKFVEGQLSERSEHKRGRWMAQELAWLRRGPQARRTKSKARIERARALLSQRGFVRPKVPELQLATAPRLSQTVIEAKGLTKRFDGRTIFQGVDLIVQPGERIGFLGKNGAGKTTLVRTLLGELPPDEGTVKVGPKTKVAYYDQLRIQLDDEDTVAEAAWHEDWIILSDRKVRLSDYLDDLGFPVAQQRQKVGALSGGERNRLLLARLFLSGANVLVLDEPTNDLDLATLSVLERLLVEFQGAVLLVTHDRAFLDKVCTALLVFGDQGRVTRYEGGYDTYRRLSSRGNAVSLAPAPRVATVEASPPRRAAAPVEARKPPRKLGYKDQRELDGMEGAIEAAERKKAELELQLAQPAVFSNAAETARLSHARELAGREVERLYARWQELQSLAGG